MRATAKDLRFHAKEILDSVIRGEEVTITYHGKPLAKIIPIRKKGKKPDKHPGLFGIWSDHDESKDVTLYVRQLREPRYK